MLEISDFWRWAYSDLLANTQRGHLAEFIVGRALGAVSAPRVEWDAVDLRTACGIGVEVKSAAYLQAWEGYAESRPVFQIGRKRAWDSITRTTAAHALRSADVYVFALYAHRERSTANPLDVKQWQFFVCSAAILAPLGEQKSIGLAGLRAIAVECDYAGLRQAVVDAMSASPAEPPPTIG